MASRGVTVKAAAAAAVLIIGCCMFSQCPVSNACPAKSCQGQPSMAVIGTTSHHACSRALKSALGKLWNIESTLTQQSQESLQIGDKRPALNIPKQKHTLCTVAARQTVRYVFAFE